MFSSCWFYLDQLLMRHVATEEGLLVIHKSCELCLFHFLSVQHQNPEQGREFPLIPAVTWG